MYHKYSLTLCKSKFSCIIIKKMHNVALTNKKYIKLKSGEDFSRNALYKDWRLQYNLDVSALVFQLS